MRRRARHLTPIAAAWCVAVSPAAAEPRRDATAPAHSTPVPSAAHDASERAPVPRDYGTCTERLTGKSRFDLKDDFPERGVSGYAAVLEVVVRHGKGETVLPGGFDVHAGSDEAKLLAAAGFVLPDPDGPSRTSIDVRDDGEHTTSAVRIPFVPLPKEPGRQQLELPPVPIAVARASGEIATLCTRPHRIVVEDPIANAVDARPRPNPPARRQLEEWTTAKHVTYGALAALALGALIAWLVSRWVRRPRPAPAPPPPRPPWEVALEELFDVRHAGLIQQGRFAEHFDRVSYIMRRYLGNRYGFDGLERTTIEVMDELRNIVPPVPILPLIDSFLRQADLVKFAKAEPSQAECEQALQAGEEIVRRTVPPVAQGEAGLAASGPESADEARRGEAAPVTEEGSP